MNDDADEWIKIETVGQILGLASPNRVIRDAGVATRRAASRGWVNEYRRADVEALADLRGEPRGGAQAYKGPDLCDFVGAQKIKRRIEEYWTERGATVRVEVVQAPFHNVMLTARYDVRSDMVDGWPRK